MNKINEGFSRDKILQYFKDVAKKENAEIFNKKQLKTTWMDRLKRIAIGCWVMGDVLMVNALVSNLKNYTQIKIYIF